MRLVTVRSTESPKEVLGRLKENAKEYGFIIRNVFDMGDVFRRHDVEVDTDFEYVSVLLCNPQRAYPTIRDNPLRGALLLQPKQVMIYRDGDGTMLAYNAFEEADVKTALPDDQQFQKGLPTSCQRIVDLMGAVA